MQAIFEEAGLSPGAVYRYFTSKEQIVQAIASETLGGFARAIEPGPDEEPLGPVELLDRFFDFIEGVELRRDRLRLRSRPGARCSKTPSSPPSCAGSWTRSGRA
jgi:AcrR family transcriptional regulator